MFVLCVVFFFKQKTADERLMSDWSADGCSSDLAAFARDEANEGSGDLPGSACIAFATAMHRDVVKLTNSSWILRPDMLAGELGLAELRLINDFEAVAHAISKLPAENLQLLFGEDRPFPENGAVTRSEGHTSELQSLMRISYA